ncbi:MAG TPA: FAD-dependent oxidoreductase [Actinomycetes bacterium]|nr:FAD-dependent oxidoreductase [Actinomycetes bacterium]
MSRVVVVGAGAAGLSAANRLALRARERRVEVVLVDRTAEHVFQPGFVGVLFGDLEPDALRRPLASLVRPGIRLVTGEVARLDPAQARVLGDFGELAFDRLVVAAGAQVGWDDAPPASGDLAPWTLAGALAAREALRRLGPTSRVVVAAATPSYRCPPAVLDLAIRLRHHSGAQITVAHPWPAPLAPFGPAPSAALTRLLAEAGVAFRGAYAFTEVQADRLVDAAGVVVPFDVALLVPPHRPPTVVAASPLASSDGWMRVDFPSLRHPVHRDVFGVGDAVAPTLKVGMAGTLGVFEGGFVADVIAAELAVAPTPAAPRMHAICFLDTGTTGSFLYCDFAAPAAGTGPAACALMPELPFFRRAKRLFADEWFTSMLTGEIA